MHPQAREQHGRRWLRRRDPGGAPGSRTRLALQEASRAKRGGMTADEEELGRLGRLGVSDRCEPALRVVWRSSQDQHVAGQRTLRALICKRACPCGACSRAAASGSSSGSSTLVHISTAGERANGCQDPFLRYHSQAQRSGTAAAVTSIHHACLVGSADIAIGTSDRPLTALPVYLPASHHQLAHTAPVPRPVARQIQSLMAVLAIPARPRQRRPMRSAAAVW